MRLFAFIIPLTLIAFCLSAQIDMSDSTFQAIGYWSINEKQSYTITHETYKVDDSDTTGLETYKYSVDITIIDSTANSYTIDWFYHNFEILEGGDLLEKISRIGDQLAVRIRTDEFGAFLEVVNWQEVRQYILKGIGMLREENKDMPEIAKILEQYDSMYSTKESIEAAAIKDILQYYSYHGGKYRLGEEINGSLKLPNLYDSSNPFDTEVLLFLDEIDPEDNNAIMRMKQTVNSDQLTKTTFNFLVKTSTNLGTEPPKWEEFPPLSNEIWLSSRIHGTGWIIYSVETREVTAEGITRVENRIIEIY